MKPGFLLTLSFLLVACGANVRDACHIEGDFLVCPKDGSRAPISVPGPTGTNGENCSVEATEMGAVITCPDGSSVEIFNGTDGESGEPVTIVCHKKHPHFVRVCERSEND